MTPEARQARTALSTVADVDNRAIGRAAALALAAHDAKRWLAVTDPADRSSHANRVAGFRSVARKLGAKVEVLPLSANPA